MTHAETNSLYRQAEARSLSVGILKLGEDEYRGHIPALIDEETWQMAQNRLHARRVVSRPDGEFLLTGVIQCAICGGAMCSGLDHRNEARGGKPWRFYRCNTSRMKGQEACTHRKSLSAEAIERKVVRALLDQVLTPDTVRRLVVALKAEIGSDSVVAEIERVRQDITRLRREAGNLTEAIKAGQLKSRAAGEELNDLERLQIAAETLLAILEERRAVALTEVDDRRLQRALDTMRAELQSEDMAVARRAIRAFVLKVEISEDSYRITYQSRALLAF